MSIVACTALGIVFEKVAYKCRCADYILRDKPDAIRVFTYSDRETAVRNVVDMYGVTEKEAAKIIEKTDKQRSVLPPLHGP